MPLVPSRRIQQRRKASQIPSRSFRAAPRIPQVQVLPKKIRQPGRKEVPKPMKNFPLKHIQTADAKDKIKGLLSEKATVESDDRANHLIVTDYNENLAQAADLIAVLDSDKPQDISVRVIPLKNVNAQDLVKEISPLYQKM